jgi:hypothetical protein
MADMQPLMSSLLHLQRPGTRNPRLFVLPELTSRQLGLPGKPGLFANRAARPALSVAPCRPSDPRERKFASPFLRLLVAAASDQIQATISMLT